MSSDEPGDEPKITKLYGPKGDPYEIIEPPNRLVRKAGGYHVDPASVARIQVKLDALSEGYPAVARLEWAAMAELWPRLRTGAGTPEEDGTFRRIVHDFKGQGGSVGYPLISEVAGSLGELLRKADPTAETTRLAIDQHVAAIGTILHNRIKGDGGAVGKALAMALQALVAKCLGGG
jgi:hypothetical protein